jgi:hypothetical protein
MKLVAEKAEINTDPRPKDRAAWQRLRIAVEDEVCHRDWGCALYRLHRLGRINNDQREAGDKYTTLIRDHRKLWHDPIGFSIDTVGQERDYDVRCAETQPVVHALGLATAEGMRDESEFELTRAKRISRRYREARSLVGGINGVLEDMLIDEIWPVGEKGHREIVFALERLVHFFNTGTKRKR